MAEKMRVLILIISSVTECARGLPRKRAAQYHCRLFLFSLKDTMARDGCMKTAPVIPFFMFSIRQRVFWIWHDNNHHIANHCVIFYDEHRVKNLNFLLLFLNNAKNSPHPSQSLISSKKGLNFRHSLVLRVEIHFKPENRTDPKSCAMRFIQKPLAYQNKRLERLVFRNAMRRYAYKIFPHSLH